MRYLSHGQWVYHDDLASAEQAVEMSRNLWRSGVKGVEILRREITVYKHAVR